MMDRKYKIPFALTILTFALVGCSTNKIKVEKVKPNPLPKLAQAKSLVPVFSQSVSATSEEDPLRLLFLYFLRVFLQPVKKIHYVCV